jgi:hypothetical protein
MGNAVSEAETEAILRMHESRSQRTFPFTKKQLYKK